MKRCLNCLEYLENDVKVCPHCGAKCDADDGFVLLSEVKAPERNYQDISSGKKSGPVRFAVILVLILALVAGISHYYFSTVSNPENPKVTFGIGTGVINDGKKIVYTTIDDPSLIEYIQGVSIYKGDLTESGVKNEKPISTDYEYTDNVDDSFRSIFFYADDIGVRAGEEYTMTFKINLQFVKDDNVYTYLVANTFSGDIKKDASDIVFDHSLKNTEPAVVYEATTVNHSDTSYIFDGYWYTMGEKTDDGLYKIDSVKFDKESDSCKITHYSTEKLDGQWDISYSDGTYSIDNGVLTYSGSDTKYVVNSDKKTLIEQKQGTLKKELTHTNYNNISNAYSLLQ